MPRAGSKFARVRCGGSLKPLRISVSRRPKKGVSTVRTMALKPDSSMILSQMLKVNHELVQHVITFCPTHEALRCLPIFEHVKL